MNKNIISILLSILLVVFIVAYIFNAGVNSDFSFAYVLDFMSDTEYLTPSFNVLSNFTITGSWGVFDFLRVTFNFFIDIVNLALYLAQNLLNVLAFVFNFFSYFFFGYLT